MISSGSPKCSESSNTSVLYRSPIGIKSHAKSPNFVPYPSLISDLLLVPTTRVVSVFAKLYWIWARARAFVFIWASLVGRQGSWSRSSRYLLIGIVLYGTFRNLQSAFAWYVFSSLVTPFSGMINAVTFSAPSASATSLSTSAESMPPDTPRTTFLWPESLTNFLISPSRCVYVFCGFFMVWVCFFVSRMVDKVENACVS